MNKTFKKLTIIFLALALAIIPTVSVQASTKTDAEKVLTYYKKGKISEAKKYNKKLAKKASKTSIKNLSKKAKAAYKKQVKKYPVYSSTRSLDDEYLWGYYLADLDGDNKAELLVEHGTCEADVKVSIFTYKSGKIKKIGDEYSGHTGFYAYPGHAGIICHCARQGVEDVSTLCVKNGKLKTTEYGGRQLKENEDYFPFRQYLGNHMKYVEYVPSIDWTDLK